MTISARPATEQDVKDLAPRLRLADVREIQAASGLSPEAALRASFKASEVCQALFVGDGPVLAIFGVCPGGVVWMIGSDDLWKHRFNFLRQSRRVTEQLLSSYRVLWNAVDERNFVHIRWLKWLGYIFPGQWVIQHDPQVKFLVFYKHKVGEPCVPLS